MQPYLIVVTGAPGSGKSTYSKKLAEALRLPLVSRDEIKEGYIRTLGKAHDELPEDTNLIATEAYFHLVESCLDRGISLIAEGAFQHRVWSHFLEPFLGKCELRVLVCASPLAAERYRSREQADPTRSYYHGISDVSGRPYEAPHITKFTYAVDTTGEYSPDFEAIEKLIFKER